MSEAIPLQRTKRMTANITNSKVTVMLNPDSVMLNLFQHLYINVILTSLLSVILNPLPSCHSEGVHFSGRPKNLTRSVFLYLPFSVILNVNEGTLQTLRFEILRASDEALRMTEEG